MSATKSCSYCKESIDKKVTKCPHCQSNPGLDCVGLLKGFIISAPLGALEPGRG
ncbi:MAG: hypothetical protein IJM59_00775 [Proteobacteria bacterium]|nr:hypothetical protein [Pseudomonadota bacterium]